MLWSEFKYQVEAFVGHPVSETTLRTGIRNGVISKPRRHEYSNVLLYEAKQVMEAVEYLKHPPKVGRPRKHATASAV